MRTLVVFEDAAARGLAVFTDLRGVFDLRCGSLTLLERLQRTLGPARLVLSTRADLRPLIAETHPDAAVHEPGTPISGDEILVVNGRLLALGDDLPRLLHQAPPVFDLASDDVLWLARRPGPRLTEVEALWQPAAAGASRAAPEAQLDVRQVSFPAGTRVIPHVWDLVTANLRALVDDFERELLELPAPPPDTPGVQYRNREAVRVAPDARLGPGTVLDAEDGPILVGPGAVLQPNCVVRGPASIGAGCTVKVGAKLHEGTTLGPGCKVGGEVEESILQGWSNKQHEGFLGHAYLGEWVNLGADTNNSDLKNNYSNVRVWENGAFIDSGQTFVGLFAADHVKSAINTSFNTGTVVGLASMVVATGFPPKYIPPFSWGTGDAFTLYRYDRALETARRVLERRQRALTAAYEAAFRRAYEARVRRDAPSA